MLKTGLALQGAALQAAEAAAAEALATGGVALSAAQWRELRDRRDELLCEVGRIELGAGAYVHIACEFADSPLLVAPAAFDLLAELQEAFYFLRADLPGDVSDDEIYDALREAFDGEAGGDAVRAAELCRETLGREDAAPEGEYTIVDDEGRVYRFDPAEWHDDITACGWDGERWGDELD